MATTENNYTGNGTLTSYTFSFPYIKKEDVKVTFDEIGTTDFIINDNTPTQIDFNTAPGANVAIRIFRETDTTATSSTFFSGSAIRAQDLNRNFEQSLFIGQEEENKIQDVISGGIADGSVNTAKIANGAVTADKLAPDVSFPPADGSITTAKLSNQAVTTAKLADANVTTAKLADANVTTAKLADANVTTAKLADANVTTAKLADDAVTAEKLDTSYLPLAGGTMSGNITFAGSQTFPSSSNGFISNSSATFTGTTNASNYTFSIPSNAKRIVINYLRLFRSSSTLFGVGINIGNSNGLWTTGQNQTNHVLIYSLAESANNEELSSRINSDRYIPLGFVGQSSQFVTSGTLTLFRITDSSNNYFSGTGTSSSVQNNESNIYNSAGLSTRNPGQTIVDQINSNLPVSQFSFVYSGLTTTATNYGITGYVSIDYYSNI